MAAGARRVLISGTADHTMLAFLLASPQAPNDFPQVTVVDLCETPLMLCKLYGRVAGVALSAICLDIRTFSTEEPFDLIVTDAFLTRFAASERKGLLNTWWKLLRPGGGLITSVRLETFEGGGPLVASADEVESFCRRVYDAAVLWNPILSRSPDELASEARVFAANMTSYPLASKESLVRLFHETGFETAQLETADVTGELKSTTYARVIARRRVVA